MNNFHGSRTWKRFWGEVLFNRLNTNPFSLFQSFEEHKNEVALQEEIKKHGSLRTMIDEGSVKDTSTHIY